MANVITLNDIAGLKDKKQLVLSKDTIITPSARDWANEQGICIVREDDLKSGSTDEEEKNRFLDTIIESIIKQMKSSNMPIEKKEVTAIVKNCLERMNCIIE